jgi:hypothetical protein
MVAVTRPQKILMVRRFAFRTIRAWARRFYRGGRRERVAACRATNP